MTPAWRPATRGDVKAISGIERAVHTLGAERPAVFADRIARFGEGAHVLADGGLVLGYGFAYPWRLGDVPPLDRLLGEIRPDADCLFVHDVALLPEGRGRGAADAFIVLADGIARRRGLPHLALVSVYGTHVFWSRCGFTERSSAAIAAQLGGYGDTARYMVAEVA